MGQHEEAAAQVLDVDGRAVEPDADGLVTLDPQNLRMKATVHMADPRTGAVSLLREGQPVPDWALEHLPADLVTAVAAGTLPASMTSGVVLQSPDGDEHDDEQHD